MNELPIFENSLRKGLVIMDEISVATYSLTEGDNGAQVSVVFSDGTAETITDKHSNFASIKEALHSKHEGYGALVYDLVNIAKTVGRKFKTLSPRVTTDGSDLYFDGDAIDNSLAQYILKLLREDSQKSAAFFSGTTEQEDDSQVTWEALVKFLESLYSNPNPQSRQSLYEFISRYGLTIRKDGSFIAYKGLQDDFGSINKGYGIVDDVEVNGTLYNKPGSVLRFPRKDVDSNTEVGCSQGLHAGTHSYATQWARGGKLVAVAIKPINVVSVPDDCTFQKLRVCEYEILNEVDPLEEAQATNGWETSSSYWPSSDWDDNYNSNHEDLRNLLEDSEVVSFDYISVDGNAQHVAEAEVEEVGDDYLKAFVPAKDGYRTFKFNGISNLEEYEGDSDYEEDYEEDEEQNNNPADSEESSETNRAEEIRTVLGSLTNQLTSDLFGRNLNDIVKEAQNLIPADALDRVKQDVLDRARQAVGEGSKTLNEVVTDIQSVLDHRLKQNDATADTVGNDLSEGDVVTFVYTSNGHSKQTVENAEVTEVQAEYFKAFVPSKDGYRTFKFDGVSDLKEAEEETFLNIKDILSVLRIGDSVDITALINHGTDTLEVKDATVTISNSYVVVVRTTDGGYVSISPEEVVKISVK